MFGVGAGTSRNDLVSPHPTHMQTPNNYTCLKVYNCGGGGAVLTAAIVAESQLCLIDSDCDWQKVGAIVWPLVLSRLRSLSKPAAGRKRREN